MLLIVEELLWLTVFHVLVHPLARTACLASQSLMAAASVRRLANRTAVRSVRETQPTVFSVWLVLSWSMAAASMISVVFSTVQSAPPFPLAWSARPTSELILLAGYVNPLASLPNLNASFALQTAPAEVVNQVSR